MDVLEYLQTKDLELRSAPNLNVYTRCFFCGENEDESKRGRLYIKVDPDASVPGLFFCHLCGERGSINKIRSFFGDPVDSGAQASARVLRVLNDACDYYVSKMDDASLAYLQDERGLEVDLIIDAQLGYADGHLVEHLLMKEHNIDDIKECGLSKRDGTDFFDAGNIIIPYFDNNQCIQLRGRDISGRSGAKYRTPPGQQASLYGLDTLVETDTVILTEGEFDALVLRQLGYAAIGVPGARSFNAEWAKRFSDIRRVYVCFDNDDVGNDGAVKTAAALGAKARIITMPLAEPGKPKNDVSEWVYRQGHTKEDFELLLRNSNSSLLVRVEDAYNAWLDREGNMTRAGLKTGIEKLDILIKPGLLRGQVMTILAKTGSGKSITAINLMHRMIMVDPQAKILFVSLEQTRNEWFERARRIFGFYNLDIPYDQINKATIDFYKDNVLIIDKNRVTPEELKTCIQQSADELGAKPDMVIVDYLGYWARAFRGQHYERVSDAIMMVKQIAKEEDLVIVTPSQVKRMNPNDKRVEITLDDARDSGVIEETSDFVLSIYRIEQDGKPTGQQGLRILKSRHGNMGNLIDFRFAPISLALVPEIDNLYEPRYADLAISEMRYRALGEIDYAQVRQLHIDQDRRLIRHHVTTGHAKDVAEQDQAFTSDATGRYS